MFRRRWLSSSLVGSCSCGRSGWKAHGNSSLNFICHCSICRSATGNPSTTSAAFKPEQITWIDPINIQQQVPQGSKNPRCYCKVCGDYLAEDAKRSMGLIAVSLDAVKGEIADSYKPNMHIFYDSRDEKVELPKDGLPKWKTLPMGEIANPSEQTWHKTNYDLGCGKRDEKSGRLGKDALPFTPTRPPYPEEYLFPESDPPPNHVSNISVEKIEERVQQKYIKSSTAFIAPEKSDSDVLIIGGGHNGLVTAAYLAKAGLNVRVLERRHCIGGAAVTEEIIPGFKFSRASYLAGLLRPKVIEELELKKYGFTYLPRNPSSFTPTLDGKYLMLGRDEAKNYESISQFSLKDAEMMPHYENFLSQVREIVQPILDGPPPSLFGDSSLKQKIRTIKQVKEIAGKLVKNRNVLVPLYELFCSPASHILDRWFESDIVKATLATDAVIGAMVSPTQATSAYVLLHHVMGESAGNQGVWSYVEGGMGSISNAIAQSALSYGAQILTSASVKKILYDSNNTAYGVKLDDGTKLTAKIIISNTTPYHTFLELLPGYQVLQKKSNDLPIDFAKHIRFADYSCGAFKINCAIDRLPNFTCCPNKTSEPEPQHIGTAHFETKLEDIENAYREASLGIPASRPVVELTIPSSLDKTISPPGKHIAQLFVQFAPYDLDPKIGNWADPAFKEMFVHRVFSIVDEFAPGFSSSIIGYDALSPLDLERIFGLHKGNIFHGSLSLHQLGYTRPAPGFSSYRTPLKNLYMCGAGTHPGGGVMGAAGRNCAHIVLDDL